MRFFRVVVVVQLEGLVQRKGRGMAGRVRESVEWWLSLVNFFLKSVWTEKKDLK